MTPAYNLGMAEDPNTLAARIAKQIQAQEETLPADLEAAWERWSAGIQQVDERVRTLLRAAFEAGVDAAQSRQAPRDRVP